ncbi:MAG: hypothetical protein HQL72_13710 [Magnetococcales bacterium]|nr:hypothetical protein [Magnetococcales bacterium]
MHKIVLNLRIGVVVLLVCCLVPLQGLAQKNPTDSYRLTLALASQVEAYRTIKKIDLPWPVIPLQKGKSPRHVLQKALEVLEKINRLRTNQKLGAISIPPYPSRPITPTEVYDMVSRLIDEMVLLRQMTTKEQEREPAKIPEVDRIKTPDDVYQNLWAISRALDPVLGVGGFSPSDVYAQSVRIVNLVQFLRQTQRVSVNIKKQPAPKGKHPNHALAATYQLLKKISFAEKNLWIAPVDIPVVPKKVITPTEVYDALQGVIAELQRIKYRLGVERHFPTPMVKPGKTPDDVIQNLAWATAMMPTFSLQNRVWQQDPAQLNKTPDDVYMAIRHAVTELERYQASLGIRPKNQKPPEGSGLQSRHVYQQMLYSIEKIDQLRRQNGLGGLAIPRNPLRTITPHEVYELALRLDIEMDIIYKNAGLTDTEVYATSIHPVTVSGKSSSDVYHELWRFSCLLDDILGEDEQAVGYITRQARQVSLELSTIMASMGYTKSIAEPPLQSGYLPSDLVLKGHNILRLLNKLQTRAGLFSSRLPIPPLPASVESNDIMNVINLIHAEVVAVKIHLGITKQLGALPVTDADHYDETYRQLSWMEMIITDLLENEPPYEGGEK